MVAPGLGSPAGTALWEGPLPLDIEVDTDFLVEQGYPGAVLFFPLEELPGLGETWSVQWELRCGLRESIGDPPLAMGVASAADVRAAGGLLVAAAGLPSACWGSGLRRSGGVDPGRGVFVRVLQVTSNMDGSSAWLRFPRHWCYRSGCAAVPLTMDYQGAGSGGLPPIPGLDEPSPCQDALSQGQDFDVGNIRMTPDYGDCHSLPIGWPVAVTDKIQLDEDYDHYAYTIHGPPHAEVYTEWYGYCVYEGRIDSRGRFAINFSDQRDLGPLGPLRPQPGVPFNVIVAAGSTSYFRTFTQQSATVLFVSGTYCPPVE